MKIVQVILTAITIFSLSTTHGMVVQQSYTLKTAWAMPFTGSYKPVKRPFYVTDKIAFNIKADLVGGSTLPKCKSLTFGEHTIQLDENQRPNLDDHHRGHDPEIKLLQATDNSAVLSIVSDQESNQSRKLLSLHDNRCFNLKDNPVAACPTTTSAYWIETNGTIKKNNFTTNSFTTNSFTTKTEIICSIPESLQATVQNRLITGFQCTDKDTNTLFITTDKKIYISTNKSAPAEITLPTEIQVLYTTQVSPDQKLICIQNKDENRYTAYIAKLDVKKREITNVQTVKTTKKPQALFFDEHNNLHTITKDSLKLPLLGWLPTTFCIRYFNTQISNGETLLRPQFFTIQKLFTSINLAVISYIAYKTAMYFGADMLQNQ